MTHYSSNEVDRLLTILDDQLAAGESVQISETEITRCSTERPLYTLDTYQAGTVVFDSSDLSTTAEFGRLLADAKDGSL
ncbi:hypothetical protein EGH24_00600 [Halonotius terrestris]|uniref:Uncharacterized protein n=1 Tax=Halonotius terrestris TaxID=2487750 RepID=A0A8J8TCI0_9EURY|nr:hypothetical protein [Halonotius terrestris]TQQ83335.1 hypothetical protein EGH24_00600 [Halonotius terrestris]